MGNGGAIGKKFFAIRNKLGLSQKQVADYLGIDQSYVSKIESGERKINFKIAKKMCDLIGYDISYFNNENDMELLKISFRTNDLSTDDLVKIARINQIVIKLREMKEMIEGN